MKKLLLVVKGLVKPLLYRHYALVMIERGVDVPVRAYRKSKRWAIREMTEGDLPRCQTHFSHQMSVFKDLFSTPCKGFVAIEEASGDVIAVAWFAPEDYYDDYHRYTFKVKSHEVFQFAGEVAEPFRNTPLAAQVQVASWKYWADNGKTLITSNVESTNSASLRLVFHMKWQESGSIIHYHRWLGLQFNQVVDYQGERFSHYQKKRKHTKDTAAQLGSE